MTLKLSERELEKLLRGDDRDLSPPAGLFERLRADLPAELPAFSPEDGGPQLGEGRVLRPAVWWRRPLVTLAASLAVVVGASFVAWRGFRETASPPVAVLEALPEAAAPEDKKVEDEEAAPLRDETLRADRLAKSAPAADSAPRNEHDRAPAGEPIALGAAGGSERRDSAPAASAALRGSPPPVPEAPAPAGEPGGVPGGIAGGFIEPLPVAPAETPPTTASTGDEPKASPGVTPKDEAKVEHRAALNSQNLRLGSSALPQRLESPSIESNATESAHLTALRESEERRKAGHLENPALQSDAGRGSRERAAALAAPPRQQVGAALQSANLGSYAGWDPIERALVAGRWPTAAEIAAARPFKKKGKVVDSAKESLAERDAEAEAKAKKDSPTALREDLLDFFASNDKTPRDLLELRRRALQLAASEPVDPEVAELVRALNFASRIATPIN